MNIQRLTIICDDQLVIVDNYGITMAVDFKNVHAVQWFAGVGEIEFCDDTPNKTFTDLAPFADLIEQHAALKAEALKPPPPPTAEEIGAMKKQWRNQEIQSVSQRLEQFRNDQTFGSDTFPFAVNGDKMTAAVQLNDYRIALIAWTDESDFCTTEPPMPPSFWQSAPQWWNN